MSVLAVVVAYEEARSDVKGRRFADLLGKPSISGMTRDPGMDDASGSVVNHDEDKDGAKEHIVALQQVTCPNGAGVVVQKGRPGLRRRTRRTQSVHVMLNGASGNMNTDLAQFALNAFGSPGMVFTSHLLEQSNDCAIHFRATGWTFGARFAAPDETEEVAVPAKQRYGLDDEEALPPVGQTTGKENQ